MEIKSGLRKIGGKGYEFFFFGLALASRVWKPVNRYIKIGLFYQRDRAISTFKRKLTKPVPPKVVVILVHIVSIEESQDSQKAEKKIERLRQTIDGLMMSLAHCDLTILVSTMPNRHIVAFLPDYQRDCLLIKEEVDCDPMYIGFQAQDELVRRVDDFDWFIFLEDDIVIQDSQLIEKIKRFNQYSGYKNALLFPNRYEFFEGVKRYIDFTFMEEDIAWNRLSFVEIDGTQYAECTNPHAGFYCLSQAQMRTWIASGRTWRGQSIYGGPRESAATFSLAEVFSLYKPYYTNLHHLEIRHYDTKYSELYPEEALYRLNPTRKNANSVGQAVPDLESEANT